MPRLIRLHEIDQFERVVRIPEAAITTDVLNGIRGLDERRELVPALREILFDPNETPHGPTEIADILTSRLTVRGERRLAAFVVKGKSFPQVGSRHVAHQFAKLRTVPDLGLSVFLAVGNIQDDAHRDFVQMALDGSTDYLIVDAVDCARLFLAYEKVCPVDGMLFGPEGSCLAGHRRDPGAKLELPVCGELYAEVFRLEDISHNRAKRYSAVLMVDRHAPRDALRKVITEIIPKIRAAEHHRSDLVASRWKGTDAHVVWLFLAGTAEDVRHANWLARAQWIDPDLEKAARPVRLGGDEEQDGVEIKWNTQYEAIRRYLQANLGSKGPLLARIRELVDRADALLAIVKQEIASLDNGETNIYQFDEALERLRDRIEGISRESGDLPFPPEDLKDLDSAAQALFGWLYNRAMYYSDLGKDKWTQEQRVTLIRIAVHGFEADLLRVRRELEKVT